MVRPSDLVSLFQDAAGTIPVTASGDPVGMIRDKSGNGRHMVQPASARRPVFQSAGGLRWLETDGSSSCAVPSRFGLAANPDIAVLSALRPLSDQAPIQRVFHLGDDNQAGTLACAMGSEGYSWRFNNGNKRFAVSALGTDAVVTWQRHAGTDYQASKLRLNGVQATAAQTANGSFTPGNTGEQAAFFCA